MLKILNILVLLALCFSCGAKKKSNPSEIITRALPGDPIPLKLSRNVGPVSYSLSKENYIFNKNSWSLFSGNTDCLDSSLVLSKRLGGRFTWDFIDKSRYYLYVNENYDSFSIYDCEKSSKKKGSFEHATSSILYSLNKVEELIDSANISISTVNINIAPLIKKINKHQRESHIDRYEQYLVNNAFYNPENKEMTFLPQGFVNGQIPFSGIPLWNVPFVPAHEFGHHIFSELVKGTSSVHTCFDHFSGTKELDHKSLLKSGIRTLVGSLNEGFADLVAQAASSPDFSFAGVDCFELNRDVKSAIFKDGTAKTLNHSYWSEFKRPSRRARVTCNTTIPSEVHTMGALIAHNIHKLIEDKTSAQKMIFLKNWLKEVNLLLDPSSSLDRNMTLILQAVYSNLKINDLSRDANLCKNMMSSFPYFRIYQSSVCK